MWETAFTANLDQLLAKIQEVEARDPQVGQALGRVAENFQYRKLLNSLGAGASI
jgi:hypothetical protein